MDWRSGESDNPRIRRQPWADSLGMVEPYGAIFSQPKPGSPAAQAGIEAGDVLTAINGQPLARSRDFAAIISKRAPGSVIYLTTFRNGELMEIKLTLGYSNCKLRSRAHRNSKRATGAMARKQPAAQALRVSRAADDALW
jgi:S1-C subfamily serine protease